MMKTLVKCRFHLPSHTHAFPPFLKKKLPAINANVSLTLGRVDLLAGEGTDLEPNVIMKC
jgi:hypothetical protein